MNEVEQLRQEVAQLRAEIDRVDDWANGVFQALSDALYPLVRRDKDLAGVLARSWRPVAEQFDAVVANPGQADSFQDTAELLEARKALYRKFDGLGLWPSQAT